MRARKPVCDIPTKRKEIESAQQSFASEPDLSSGQRLRVEIVCEDAVYSVLTVCTAECDPALTLEDFVPQVHHVTAAPC